MKKLIAIVLVMSMLLSCTAFAVPAKTGTQTTAQFYINPQLVAGEGEEVLTVIETLNSLELTMTEGADHITYAIGANGTEIAEHTMALTGEGELMYFSSLYPNTAILLDFAKVAALVEKVVPVDLESVMAGLAETGTGIMNMLTPYVQDVYALIGDMQGEILTDETGANVYLEITSKHLGTLLSAWLTRLSSDSRLKALLSQVYAMAMQNEYGAPSFEEMLSQLKSEVETLKNNEPVVISTAGVFNENGVTTYEITVGNMLLVSVDSYLYEGKECLDVLALMAQNGTDNWQTTYEDIYNGTDDTAVMFGLGTAFAADYNYLQLYTLADGQTVTATLEQMIENLDTDDQVTTTMLSFDLAQGEESINLGGYAAETILVEDTGMPSLEGKYVLDIMALPIDMLANGLPTLGQNIVAAMPEMVQMVIDALSELEGLEFLQMIQLDTEPEVTNETTPQVNTKVGGTIEDM